MGALKDEITRIKVDLGHGKQLGEKSTLRLIGLIDQIIDHVEDLEREFIMNKETASGRPPRRGGHQGTIREAPANPPSGGTSGKR
jgi:hypothetical protein